MHCVHNSIPEVVVPFSSAPTAYWTWSTRTKASMNGVNMLQYLMHGNCMYTANMSCFIQYTFLQFDHFLNLVLYNYFDIDSMSIVNIKF